MSLLKDKNILIMGVRNKWSIAYGIAKAAKEHGAKLIFTYPNERELEGAKNIANEFEDSVHLICDVTSDEDIERAFNKLKEEVGVLHGLVHSIAHAKTEDLHNEFVNTSRDGFMHAMNISAYSLIAVTNKAMNLMPEGGSILTLTFMGSEKVLPGYNVMGVAKAALESSVRYLADNLGDKNIRVNAISAGSIKTLSARGVKNFNDMLHHGAQKAPMKRNVNLEDLGGSGVYLLSSLSSGVTGEIHFVDCGYNISGV